MAQLVSHGLSMLPDFFPRASTPMNREFDDALLDANNLRLERGFLETGRAR